MKILFLTSRFPFPLEKGDKLRAYFQLRDLSEKNQIILMSVSDKPVNEADFNALKPFCKKMVVHFIGMGNVLSNIAKNFFSDLPFQVRYFSSKRFKEKIMECIREEKPDVIYCQLPRMADYVIDVKDVPKMIDYMDAFSKGLERMADTVSFFKRPFVKMEYRRMKKYEAKIFNHFQAHSIISSQDAQFILHDRKGEIKIIPNGVDLNFYKSKPEEKKYELLFAGNMSYAPNVESAGFIVEKILPLLLKKYPKIKLVLAGADPSPSVKKLASDNVIVTGWVDDIRSYFNQSKIHLAPMLISIGMQNKILQAMAMKIPNITTTLANNAIHAADGKEILIANSAEDFASAIEKILSNESIANTIAENALSFVQRNYEWKSVNQILENELMKISKK